MDWSIQMFGKSLFAGLVGLLVMVGCAQSSNPTQESVKNQVVLRPGVEVQEFEKLMKEQGVVLLDVRSPSEFTEGHIAKAVNIDVKSDQFTPQIQKLDKSKHYLVYCFAGVRTQKACEIMVEQGFTNYDWLTTGITGWKSAGKPVTKEN